MSTSKIEKKETEQSFSRTSHHENKPSWWSSVNAFLICLTLILSTVFYGAVDSWAGGLLFFLATLMILFWVFESFQIQEIRFSSNLIQIPLIGLIFIGLIQLLPLGNAEISADLLQLPITQSLSLNPYSTRMFVVNLFVYLIVLAVSLVLFNNRQQIQKVSSTIIVFGTVMAFFAILQSLADTEGIYGVRPTPQSIALGSFVNRHHFAALMEMILALSLGVLLSNSVKKEKLFLLIFATILMLIALLFSGSRSGILGLLGIIAFVVLMSFSKNKDEHQKSSKTKNFAFLGGTLALITVVFGGVLYLGGADSLSRGMGVSDSLQTDFTTGREHIWKTTWQIILNNPFLGTGLDTFGTAFPKYDTLNGTFYVEYAHNEYLQIWSDAGVFGFLILLGFIFLLFKIGIKAINQTNDRYFRGIVIGSLGGCLGILIHSFFDFPLRTPSNALFFLVLVAFSTTIVHIPKRVRKHSEK